MGMVSNGSSSRRKHRSDRGKDRRVGLIFNERMCKHFAPNEEHPECPDRIRAIWDQLNSSGLAKRCIILDAKDAEDNHLALVHTKKHIDLIKNISSKRNKKRFAARFDSVYFNIGSTEAASLAAGSVIEAAEKVAKGELDSAFAIVRPPGHHAEEGEPMGFCLYNNVGVATKFLLNERSELGINKILIVDWDVHHGNGTQKMFYNDPRVLFFSVHRYDQGTFYPSSHDGSYIMTGEEPGAGHNINVPWEHGQCGDADYLAVWDHILIPVAKEFNPDLIIISAGFDAAIGDPLGGCCISPYGYSIMLDKLMEFAGGKIVMALEGGYNLNSIASSARACVEVLLHDKPSNVMFEAYPFASTWRVIQEVRRELSTYWPVLAVELPKKLIRKTTHFEVVDTDTDTGFPDQNVPVDVEREYVEEANQLPDNLCEFEVIRNGCRVSDSTMGRIKIKLPGTEVKALAAVKKTSVTTAGAVQTPSSTEKRATISPTGKRTPETSEPEQPLKRSKSVIKATTGAGRTPISPTMKRALETSEPEHTLKRSKSVIKVATSANQTSISPTRKKAPETSEPKQPKKRPQSVIEAATSASLTPISLTRKKTPEPEQPVTRSKSVFKAATSDSRTPFSPTRQKAPETSEPDQPLKRSKSVIKAATGDSLAPISPTRQKAPENSETEQPLKRSKSVIKAATGDSLAPISPTRQKAPENSETEQSLKRSKSVIKATTGASRAPISPTRQKAPETSEPGHPLKRSESVIKAATSANGTPISPTRQKAPETSEPGFPLKRSESVIKAATSANGIPISPTRQKAPETSEPEHPLKMSKSVIKAATSASQTPISPTRKKAPETSKPKNPLKRSKSVIKAATSAIQTPISPTRKKAPETSEPEHSQRQLKSVTDTSTGAGQTPISPTRKRVPETSEPKHPLKRPKSVIDSDKAPPSLPPSGQSREVDIHVLGSSDEATGTQGQSLLYPKPSVAQPLTHNILHPVIAEVYHRLSKKIDSRSPSDSLSLKPSVDRPPTTDLSPFFDEIRRCLNTNDSESPPGSLDHMAFLDFRGIALALLGSFRARKELKSLSKRLEVGNNILHPVIAEVYHRLSKKIDSRSPSDSLSLMPSVDRPPTTDLSPFFDEIHRCLNTNDSESPPGSLDHMTFLDFRGIALALLGSFRVRKELKSLSKRLEVGNNKQAEGGG